MILQEGDSGTFVQKLQIDLNALALLSGGLVALMVKTDGDFGPKTKAAVIAAQHLLGLEEDGQAGPDTSNAIEAYIGAHPTPADPAKPTAPADTTYPWQDKIRSWLGNSEITGAKATEFDKMIFSHTDDDEVAKSGTMASGCAATICASLELSGYKSPHNAAAISFKNYGTACSLKQGAILVFEWKPGEHHVTTCDGIVDAANVRCLGGNQNYLVKDSVYPRSCIIAVRWPVKA